MIYYSFYNKLHATSTYITADFKYMCIVQSQNTNKKNIKENFTCSSAPTAIIFMFLFFHL